ncbi:MAG: septum formation initiator family protein [Candidatus Moranbacteria bacterium]|nr:septum formation initiator family protein [Candidatus Moranbacteria bacterium]
MKNKSEEKTNTAAKIFSGIFFLAGFVILALIGVSLGKKIYRKNQTQKEIEKLQAQIQELKQDNDNMDGLISYLSSTDFQEKEAREKLSLQKNDEKMIVLQKDAVQPEKSESDSDQNKNQLATEPNNTPNWQKWLNFFFENKS